MSSSSVSEQYAHGLSHTWVGLTSQEGKARLSEYGPNDPSSTHRGALAFELLHLFLNPLVIILLVASDDSAHPVSRKHTTISLCKGGKPWDFCSQGGRNPGHFPCRLRHDRMHNSSGKSWLRRVE